MSILNKMISAMDSKKKRGPAVKTNILAVGTLSTAHSISVRRFADDIFAGRVYETDGERFLVSDMEPITKWSDTTVLQPRQEGDVNARLGLVEKGSVTLDGQTKTIVRVMPDAEANLKKMGIVSEMSPEQRDAAEKYTKAIQDAAKKAAQGKPKTRERATSFLSSQEIDKLLAAAKKKAETENAGKPAAE